jgi:hypothetical protein
MVRKYIVATTEDDATFQLTICGFVEAYDLLARLASSRDIPGDDLVEIERRAVEDIRSYIEEADHVSEFELEKAVSKATKQMEAIFEALRSNRANQPRGGQ